MSKCFVFGLSHYYFLSLSKWDLFPRERFLSLFLHFCVPFPFLKEREIAEAWRYPWFVTGRFQVPPFEYVRRVSGLGVDAVHN